MTATDRFSRVTSPARPEGLAVEVVDTYADFVALRADWASLLTASADRSPFLTWEWADAWWRTFSGRDRLHVIVVREDARVIALAPFMRCGLVGRFPPVYIGIGQEAADYGGALLGPDPARAGEAVLAHLERLVLAGGTVVLARLSEEGDLLPRLRSRYDESGAAEVRLTTLFAEEYPFLDLAALPDPDRHVSRAWKKNDVRRRVRRLSEHASVEFVQHRSPLTDSTALDDFFRLHDARWAQKGETTGARAAGLFATESGRRFVRNAAVAADAAGFLRLSFVNVDSLPVAGRFGFEYAGRYYGLKSAFDPAMSTHGPGHMAVGFLLQQAVADGIQRFDFMRGAGAHKHAWADQSKSVGYYLLHRSGRIGDTQRAYAWNVLRWRNRLRFRR